MEKEAVVSPPDIIALRQFYSSALGRRLKDKLRAMLRERVQPQAGELSVGMGYAVPLLRHVLGPQHTAIALMPAAQGALYWPVHEGNRTALCDLHTLPLHDNSIHRIILLHALEYAPHPDAFLKECWRVLVPGGRMYVVVPRARRLWRALGDTPFRSGESYTPRTLRALLRTAALTEVEMRSLCAAPPSQHPLMLRLWRSIEWVLSLLVPALGSVLMVEAEKQIYAAIAQPVRVHHAKKVIVAQPVTSGSVSPRR
jgi:SAM-dependent methyltransferase